jgi:hypothetical protein
MTFASPRKGARLIRSAPMKRGRMAKRRPKRDEPIVKGRPAETVRGYQALTSRLIARSGGYCEVFGRPIFGTEVCHVQGRGAGGADDDWNTYWGSRRANMLQQAPFNKGRLVMTRVIRHGIKGIEWQIVVAADKWHYMAGEYVIAAEGFIAVE